MYDTCGNNQELIKDTSKNINLFGLTLIEVIISVAILAVIALAYISVITNSYIEVRNIGRLSQAMYEAETGAEKLLNNESFSDSESVDKTLLITFGSNTISVPGKVITVEVDVSGNERIEKTDLMIFVPD